MNKIEEWQLNAKIIQEVGREKGKLCSKDDCPQVDKQTAFCDHFNLLYHGKWKQILEGSKG